MGHVQPATESTRLFEGGSKTLRDCRTQNYFETTYPCMGFISIWDHSKLWIITLALLAQYSSGPIETRFLGQLLRGTFFADAQETVSLQKDSHHSAVC